MKLGSLAPVFIFSIAGSSFASGIDCDRAIGGIEKLVCDDPGVLQLDEELGYVFGNFLQNTTPNDRPKAVMQEKSWIVEVRNHCADSACLRDVYINRLKSLSQIDGDVSFIYDPKEIDETMASIRSSFRQFGISGDLKGCDPLIRLGSGRQHSFGARCYVNNRALHVCNDTMVGKLTVSFEPPGSTASVLSQFTKDNCPLGG
jgi:uncharacterized protein